MTTTNTIVPVVKETSCDVMKGDVFFGSFDTYVNGKRLNVQVSNHIKDVEKTYNFRVASKCQAGFVTISDWNQTPSSIIRSWKKNVLVNVQVEIQYADGGKLWANVFTTKGGKWYSIDLGFLKVLTVGDMRQSFPDMCDMNLWELVGAKTWADKAFTNQN